MCLCVPRSLAVCLMSILGVDVVLFVDKNLVKVMVVFSRYEGRYGCLSWAKPVVASFQEDFRSFTLLLPLKCELAVVTWWFNFEYVTLRYKVCPVSLFFGVKRVGPSGANVSSRSSDFTPRFECFVVAVWRLVWDGSRTASMVAAASLTVLYGPETALQTDQHGDLFTLFTVMRWSFIPCLFPRRLQWTGPQTSTL